MRLTPVLLPSDAASILESELPLFDAIERAETPEARADAIAAARGWVVQVAAQLRQADPRGAAKQAQQQAAPQPPVPAKPPCGCKDAAAPPPTAASSLGEMIASRLLARFSR